MQHGYHQEPNPMQILHLHDPAIPVSVSYLSHSKLEFSKNQNKYKCFFLTQKLSRKIEKIYKFPWKITDLLK